MPNGTGSRGRAAQPRAVMRLASRVLLACVCCLPVTTTPAVGADAGADVSETSLIVYGVYPPKRPASAWLTSCGMSARIGPLDFTTEIYGTVVRLGTSLVPSGEWSLRFGDSSGGSLGTLTRGWAVPVVVARDETLEVVYNMAVDSVLSKFGLVVDSAALVTDVADDAVVLEGERPRPGSEVVSVSPFSVSGRAVCGGREVLSASDAQRVVMAKEAVIALKSGPSFSVVRLGVSKYHDAFLPSQWPPSGADLRRQAVLMAGLPGPPVPVDRRDGP